MPDDNLRGQSIEYFLKRVMGLSSIGDTEQVRSIMAVVARCTIELADQARQLSEDLNHAKTILGTRLSELTDQINVASKQASADINTAKGAFLPAVAELISELKQTRLSIYDKSAESLSGTINILRCDLNRAVENLVTAIGNLVDASNRNTRTMSRLMVVYIILTAVIAFAALLQLAFR